MKRAPYCADPLASRGRRFAEPASGNRSDFQRDRDRIVHSTAFRRLEYKTQVFLNHEGDHFRTRLTHSIEVAQIARTIGRTLALDEDLIEAIALAHDLGHTPFGHAGQDALNDCMQPFGGFEHNLQSLRVVETLEQRYFEFDGLNLCFETREGILKHCSLNNARKLGELGQRFLRGQQPSLEAQVANLADEIAYNNHDVDDGLRSGLVTLAQLESVDLFADHVHVVQATWPSIQGRRLVHETVRRMINELVVDLLDETRRRLTLVAPDSVEAVRQAGPLVAFSASMTARSGKLKQFLRDELYRHEQVQSVMEDAKTIVRTLFEAYVAQPDKLPDEHRARVQAIGERAVADYIAGMTDRYAIREHVRLFGPRESALGRAP